MFGFTAERRGERRRWTLLGQRDQISEQRAVAARQPLGWRRGQQRCVQRPSAAPCGECVASRRQ